MGSGILLAVLVLLWVVVLVPALLNNRSQGTVSVSNERLGSTMRVLNRRGSGKAAPRVSARPPRVSPQRQAAEIVARRKRTLLGLLTMAMLWLVLAMFYRSYFWTAQIVLDLMVFGYVAYLRVETQREQDRRARRTARFTPRPTVNRSTPQRVTAADVAPPPANINPDGWTPLPVPLPTYVGKAMAPQRHYQLDELSAEHVIELDDIELDDEDPGLADIAEWKPQRAVGD